MIKTCPTCGKKFEIKWLSHYDRRKYCSRTCKRQNSKQRNAMLKNFSGEAWNKDKKCPEISARQMGENNPMWKGGIQKKKGYLYRYVGNQKYRPEHRFVVEAIIKRELRKTEIIHHVNGNRSDNGIENLQYFRNKHAHQRIHHFAKRFNINLADLRIEWEKIYGY